MMRRDKGEMFVEAIIAAAIVAVALGGAFQVIADSAARGRKAEAHRAALLVAQSELAEVGADIPLEAGQDAGVAGNLVWRVDITPYAAEGDANSVGALWKVVVSVRPRSGGAPLAVLESLRLARAADS
ncbi:MAG TPA: hypothetical protein VII63_10465 [Caulobacteraceae bacterium]